MTVVFVWNSPKFKPELRKDDPILIMTKSPSGKWCIVSDQYFYYPETDCFETWSGVAFEPDDDNWRWVYQSELLPSG